VSIFQIDTLTYLKSRHLKISPVKVTVKLTHFKRPPLDSESKVQESGWCTGSVLALGKHSGAISLQIMVLESLHISQAVVEMLSLTLRLLWLLGTLHFNFSALNSIVLIIILCFTCGPNRDSCQQAHQKLGLLL
jgi:hypothetical protein